MWPARWERGRGEGSGGAWDRATRCRWPTGLPLRRSSCHPALALCAISRWSSAGEPVARLPRTARFGSLCAFGELPGHLSFLIPFSPDKLHFLWDLATWQGNHTSQIAPNPWLNCSLHTEKRSQQCQNDFCNEGASFLPSRTTLQPLCLLPRAG